MGQDLFTDRWLKLAQLAYLWQASGKFICRKNEKYLDRSPTHAAPHLVVYVGTYTHKEEEFFVFCSVAYLWTK